MNKELLEELDVAYKKMQQELGLEITFEELNEVFFVKDLVLEKRYVAPRLSRMIAGRIVALFNQWGGYLHALIMPNPGSMISVDESKLFNEEEKNKIIKTMTEFLVISSENSIIGLTKDKEKEKLFFRKALDAWNKRKDFLIEITKRTNQHWIEESKKDRNQSN